MLLECHSGLSAEDPILACNDAAGQGGSEVDAGCEGVVGVGCEEDGAEGLDGGGARGDAEDELELRV